MNLLIEIFSEEIPGRMQREAEEKGQALLEAILAEHGLAVGACACWVSPRRLALFAKNVPSQTERLVEERRGPRLTSPDAALAGFLKSTNLKKEDLRQSGDYYYADLIQEAQLTETMMPSIVHAFLDRMPWPKVMRWHNPVTNDFTRTWIRPIRSITCLLDEQSVCFPVDGLNLTTTNVTKGHRFLCPDQFSVSSADTYLTQLAAAHVVLSFEERKAAVLKALTDEAAKKGLLIKEDLGLLDEVTGLVDFPFAHIGTIPSLFMALPMEVLSTSMRVHQKYFTLLNQDGTMAPYFGVITNVPTVKGSTCMMEGLERVLTARLSDAHFFYETDLKTSLEKLAEKCDSVTFHEKTGSLGDKLWRIHFIISQCGDYLALTPVEIAQLEEAARLCKSDLFTQMVGEFPELQGIMGRLYALAHGKSPAVADALEQHYQPLGPNRSVPQQPVSRALALIDKVDTLVGFLGNDIKPTGNKDPLAIRRTALGVIRLLVEGGPLDAKDFVCREDALLRCLITKTLEAYQQQDHLLLEDTAESVYVFIQNRFDVYKKG